MRQKQVDFCVLLITAAWVVLTATGAAIWMWKRSEPDIRGARLGSRYSNSYPVSTTVTAGELWKQFADDESAEKANQKFDEEYIEVRGKVKTVDQRVIILATGDESHGIECSLLRPEDAERVQEGDQITIQGQSPHRPSDGSNVVLQICRIRR